MMPVLPKLTYRDHKEKWKNCQLCTLCKRRRRVVLGKGKLPADVLFVGEAPGASEDVVGQPFVGPAGHLLDRLVAGASNGMDLRFAYTNLIACIPKDESGDKVGEPEDKWIHACTDRLEEFLELARPKLLVCVGKLPAKWIPKKFGHAHFDSIIEVMHPAAILRAEVSVRSLLMQRAMVTLADAFSEIKV